MSPILCCTHLPSALTLMGEVQIVRVFERVSWPAAARLEAQPPFLMGRLQQPGKGYRHRWVDVNVQVFTLTVLPAQSAQVLFLSKNVTLNCGENCPYQDSMQVFHVSKGQGGQIRTIVRSHPHGTSGSSTSAAGASPTRASALSYISAASAATSAASLSSFPVAATFATSVAAATFPTYQLCQIQRQ